MYRTRVTAVGIVATLGAALSLAIAASAASPAPPLPSTSINGLAVGPDGRVYGADCYGSHIFRFDLDGPVVVAGSGLSAPAGDGGLATDAGLDCPFGMVLDGRGLFILDHGHDSIRLVDQSGMISTFAGPGPFRSPIGLAIDATGNLYVGDRDARMVRKVDTAGVVTTIAGTGEPGFSGDGGPATSAELSAPEAIAVDGNGDVFFVDADNSYRIRRIDPAGTITTVAGNGTSATSGDGGPATAASLDHPQEGLVVDPTGALYVTEGQRIRHIDPDGTITTFAGTGEAGNIGDGGPATAARLQDPAALAMDRDGVLYVSSDGDVPGCVRAIGRDGIIRSVWCHP